MDLCEGYLRCKRRTRIVVFQKDIFQMYVFQANLQGRILQFRFRPFEGRFFWRRMPRASFRGPYRNRIGTRTGLRFLPGSREGFFQICCAVVIGKQLHHSVFHTEIGDHQFVVPNQLHGVKRQKDLLHIENGRLVRLPQGFFLFVKASFLQLHRKIGQIPEKSQVHGLDLQIAIFHFGQIGLDPVSDPHFNIIVKNHHKSPCKGNDPKDSESQPFENLFNAKFQNRSFFSTKRFIS